MDWIFRRPQRQVLGIMVVALAAFDLLSQGGRFINAQDLEAEPRWQRIDAALPGERSSYRLLTIGELDHNQSMALGFYGVGGYDPLVVAQARNMIDASLALTDSVLDMLSVKYIVHDARLPDLESRAQLVIQSNDLFVYERSSAMPRAFSVGRYELSQRPLFRMRDPAFDPRDLVLLSEPPDCMPQRKFNASSDTLAIRDYKPDYVHVEATLEKDRLVVLNDLYYPGWEATIDGRPVDIMRANYALRAVCVPAGAHRIEFRYQPWWIVLSIGVSATAWGATLILLACRFGTRKRR